MPTVRPAIRDQSPSRHTHTHMHTNINAGMQAGMDFVKLRHMTARHGLVRCIGTMDSAKDHASVLGAGRIAGPMA